MLDLEAFLASLVLNYYINLKHRVTRQPLIMGWNLVPCILSSIHHEFIIFIYGIIIYSCIRIKLDGFDKPSLCLSSWCLLVACGMYMQ